MDMGLQHHKGGGKQIVQTAAKHVILFPILVINKWTKKKVVSEYLATCTDDNMCHVLKNMSFYHLTGPHFLCLLLSPPQG